jgi:hypothetical protein
VPLAAALTEEPEHHIRAATAWSIGQIGRHTPDHAKAVADTGVLMVLAALESDKSSSEDLKIKARQSLRAVVGKLTHLPALNALVQRKLPESIMKTVLEQLGKVLAHDASGRADFVRQGGLERILQITDETDASKARTGQLLWTSSRGGGRHQPVRTTLSRSTTTNSEEATQWMQRRPPPKHSLYQADRHTHALVRAKSQALLQLWQLWRRVLGGTAPS